MPGYKVNNISLDLDVREIEAKHPNSAIMKIMNDSIEIELENTETGEKFSRKITKGVQGLRILE